MRMHNGFGLRHALVDVVVHSPLARGLERSVEVPLQVHEHDLVGPHLVVGHTGRGDHEAARHTATCIPRGALVDAHGFHLQARLDDLAPRLSERHLPRARAGETDHILAGRCRDCVLPLKVAQVLQLAGLLPVRLKLRQHNIDLLVWQHHGRGSDGHGADVLARQTLRLVGEPQRLVQVRAVANHAVVGEEGTLARLSQGCQQAV
mmetsp:Transcript_53205/g.152482  ORF Transcript_53205/g.152482 Transcript_53205/m.152482 type:complete len:205 (-) Transcript_53205:203-817(-)